MTQARILIVEDSELAASALRVLFEGSGYEVSIAGSVRQAVELGMERPHDVMLLDLTLPDGDGLAVIQRLRAGEREPRRIVALTGHDDDELRQRCMDAGCVDVLLKPVPIARLLELVRSP